MSIPDLSILSAKYGAPMGRHSDVPLGEAKMHLHKLPICSGGYDGGNAYWGLPDDLWRVVSDSEDEDDFEMFIRAKDRKQALADLKEEYPDLEILPLELHFQSALTACINVIDEDWALSAEDYDSDPSLNLDDESQELVAKLLKEFVEQLGPDAALLESADLGTNYWMIRQYDNASDGVTQRMVDILMPLPTLEWEVVDDHLHIYP